MIPWTAFLVQAVRDALPAGWRRRREARETLFLLLWAGLVFAFFSPSSSKLVPLVPYILPVVPPLALLLGWYLDRRIGARGERLDSRELRLATGVLLLLAGGLGAGFALTPRLLGRKTEAGRLCRRALFPPLRPDERKRRPLSQCEFKSRLQNICV